MNQRQPPPIDKQFVSLGTYRFSRERPAVITVSNQDPDGYVVIDAVRISRSEIRPHQGCRHSGVALGEVFEGYGNDLSQEEGKQRVAEAHSFPPVDTDRVSRREVGPVRSDVDGTTRLTSLPVSLPEGLEAARVRDWKLSRGRSTI